MALEILQAEGDIREFVQFLYESGYSLSHRYGPMKNIVLSPDDAVDSLGYDLYMAFDTYDIGGEGCSSLLGFTSCGMGSHPSKVYTQGRCAGVIVIDSTDKERAAPVFKRIKQYIRKHYVYQQYNPGVKMFCYFGPHYMEFEDEWSKVKIPPTVCLGSMHVVCNDISKNLYQKRISETLDNRAGIYLNQPDMNWKPYWANKKLWAVSIPFQFDALILGKDECIRIASGIIGQSELTEIHESRVILQTAHHPPMCKVEQLEGECEFLAIWQLPWSG